MAAAGLAGAGVALVVEAFVGVAAAVVVVGAAASLAGMTTTSVPAEDAPGAAAGSPEAALSGVDPELAHADSAAALTRATAPVMIERMGVSLSADPASVALTRFGGPADFTVG
ncbi:hypothetical protein L3i22_023370 [Actinoplanes sp. L3-i22]|nr:hypothetical protein L3i22_023370 [Actinoplanes sp. L3-i22]